VTVEATMRALAATIVTAMLVSAAALPRAASAAPCAGFVDIDDQSPFCGNVQWIRNRAITFGCPTLNSYCPGDPVIRLSMALFLQRLGLALTPEYLQGAQPFNQSLDSAPVVCIVTPLLTGRPHIAEGIGSFMTLSNNGAADIAVQFVESTNVGQTWTPVSPVHAISVGDQQSASLVLLLGPRTLAAGTQYQYGLRISRVDGSATTGNPTNATCRSRLAISNRNPATAPLDE
jgi:hypothetical protein